MSVERILDRMADIPLSEAKHGPAGDHRLKWDRAFLTIFTGLLYPFLYIPLVGTTSATAVDRRKAI